MVNLFEVFVYRETQRQVFNHLFLMAKDESKRFCAKMLKMKLKGGLIVPVLALMKSVWLYGLFKVFGLEATPFIYFNCFMLLRTIQFYMVADGIRIKLELINEDLIDLLNTEKDKRTIGHTIDLQSVRAKIEKIRSDYLYLKDLTITLNDSDGWSMLFVTLLFTCLLICSSYWFMIGLFKDIIVLETYQNVFYIIFNFSILAIISDPCTQCIGLVRCVFRFLLKSKCFIFHN